MLNFKKIEIYGFKSFADKTVINFTGDITSIVGPNGCGKSNVADAIRWVLGEGSARQLRSPVMRDVIFSGTETRKSQSYCEVSLHFDNADRIFTIDFDELIFTRKMDKSGESDYFINRNPCKRRDIINLLYNTGLGKEGYSIIGQNKGDEILSAKPSERRLIFEEAAGISKFKNDKEDIEKELGVTKSNLERIEIVLDGMERRLRPLEKQVEIKRRYDEIYAQLKSLEANRFLFKYESGAAERERITDKLIESKTSILEKESTLATVWREYESAKAKYTAADESIIEHMESLGELRVYYEKTAGEVKEFAVRLDNAREQESRLKGELGAYRDRAAQNVRDTNEIKNAREVKAEELSERQAELEEISSKSAALDGILSVGESDIKDAAKMVSLSFEELAALKQNLGSLITLRDLNAERLEHVKQEQEKTQTSYDAEKTEFAVQDGNLTSFTFKKKKAADAYSEAVEEKKDAENSAREYADSVMKLIPLKASVDARLKTYEDSKNNYNAYNDTIRMLMRDAKRDPELASKILGTVAEIIKVPTEYAVAIDVSLGASLQNIVTENDDDAKFLIGYLKRKQYHAMTFLPLRSIQPRELGYNLAPILREQGVLGTAADIITCEERFRPVLRHLLGNTVVTTNYDIAVDLSRKYNKQVKIVSLDGSVVHAGGAMTGGSRNTAGSSILQLEKEIVDLKAKSVELEKKLSIIERAKAAAEASLAGLTESIQTYAEEVSKLNTAIDLARQKRDAAKSLADTLEVQLVEKNKELEELTRSVKDASDKIDLIDRTEAQLRSRKDKSAAKSEQTQTELDEAKRNKAKYETQKTGLMIAVTELKNTIGKFDEDLLRLHVELKHNEQISAETEANLKSITALIDQHEVNLKKKELSPEEREKLKFLEEKLDRANTEKKQLSEVMTGLENHRNLLMNEISELKQSTTRLEATYERLENEIKNLSEYIFEEYGLNYEGALRWKSEEYVHSGADAEIKRLKTERTKLGDVNHNALEEYEELVTVYNHDKAQHDDLVLAEEKLTNSLNTLITKMTDQFERAFNKINENFKILFKELFEGGKADMRLEIPEGKETLLDAEIIIKASPPGKKIEHLSQLSGGERAMLVIAILLAILRTKPMPFCVLDEIEAPLDESNCRIFGQCLQGFTDQTQFIVITHKKPTMEVANSLYGVTMEEKGVSKVVSVALAEAVKHSIDDSNNDDANGNKKP
ncbi:MAG: chromosome segregation protein SMC [Clostridiaceae bacterium]|jgi:chromosome segregation protein|nr:chromosome segregation protein SMC [Clostridiaceae bacterium]